MQAYMYDIARIGMGFVFFLTTYMDIRCKDELFDLMTNKRVRMQWLCYLGAMAIKAGCGLALMFNCYVFIAALILAAYDFIANLIFNDFWAASKDKFHFCLAGFMTHLIVCFGILAIAAGSAT